MRKIFIGIVLILTILLLMPFLHQGFYMSHDGENHVARFAAYFHAFQSYQIIPRWAGGTINNGFGSPIFIFFYPLPGYVASFFHAIGISNTNTFTIVIVLAYFFSGISFYFWAKKLFSKQIAWVTVLFYILAPYHLLDLYVRGDIGEIFSFVFIPLVLFFIEKYREKENISFLFLGGLSYGLMILSHNVMSLIFTPIFIGYILLRFSLRGMWKVYMIILLGLFLSAFFWVPALIESKYLNTKVFLGNVYLQHFPSPFSLIYSQWGFGPDVNKIGGLSPQIGIFFLLGVVMSIFVLRKKTFKKDILYWLVVFIIGIFMMTPLSIPVWSHIQLLKNFQFPWRFVALSTFAATVLTGYVLTFFKSKKLLVVISFLLILSSIPFIKVRGYTMKNDIFYEKFSGTTYYHGEASPIWAAGDPSAPAKNPIEIIAGKGVLEKIVLRDNTHTCITNSKEDITILDNTLYFPGWQVFVDGNKTSIEFQDIHNRGFITFHVPKGIHHVRIQFVESPVRLFSDIVSLVTLTMFIGWFIFVKVHKT